MNLNRIFASVAVVIIWSLTFNFYPKKNSANAPTDSNRSIASTTIRYTNNRIAPVRVPTPIPTPILSPDSPIQPRVSSAQARDPAINNLLNFFNLNVINQPTVPEALCNDGSKPTYYLKRGFGAGAKRWIIWLEGGGACGSDDPNDPLWCGLRAAYSISSNNLPGSALDLEGILTKSDFYNPDFYSYNQVLVHYCSSDFWGGTGVQKEINPATHQKFWFSGRKIIEALVLDLKQKYSFSSATNVILTGSSAGGAGIVINSDEIKASIPTTDVVTLVDSSNFFAYHEFESGLVSQDEWTYQYDPRDLRQAYYFLPMEGNRNCLRDRSRNTCGPNERCASTAHECMLPGNAAPYLTSPVFMSSDQLDHMVLASYQLNLCNNTNPQDYQPWLNDYISAGISKAQMLSGYFLSRTGDHGLAPTHHWSTPVVDGSSSVRLRDVFGAWYFNRTTYPKRFIQSAPAGVYPHEEISGLCSGGNFSLLGQ